MTTTVGYATKGSEVTSFDGPNLNLLDAMMAAQDAVGVNVTWTKLAHTVARGVYSFERLEGLMPRGEDRVIAIDLDNADVRDAVAATIWVNEA